MARRRQINESPLKVDKIVICFGDGKKMFIKPWCDDCSIGIDYSAMSDFPYVNISTHGIIYKEDKPNSKRYKKNRRGFR